jgi:hypothetical protein
MLGKLIKNLKNIKAIFIEKKISFTMDFIKLFCDVLKSKRLQVEKK